MSRLLLFDDVLTDKEFDELAERAWDEEFGSKRRTGSIHHFAFLAHHYAGERRLEKLGKLDLFSKTRRLPDYKRAEDAVKRGWGRYVQLEYGLNLEEGKEPKKILRQKLLYQIHHASDEARESLLREFIEKQPNFWKTLNCEFIRRLGHALDESPRAREGINDTAQVMLAHWLTGFWWLMPLKAVGADMARIQGKAGDIEAVKRFSQRVRKLTSRSAEGCTGGFFSRGWNGVFYSTAPLLIDHIGGDGAIQFTPEGKRLLNR